MKNKKIVTSACLCLWSLTLTDVALAKKSPQCPEAVADVVLTKKHPNFSLNSNDLNTSYNVCDNSGDCQTIPFINDGVNSL
ncbi:MAG: hypothetical protein ACXWTP_07410, partial [Methylosarcina sp.]